MPATNQPEQPQSRLDREIDEILEQARNRPISFEERVAQKKAALQVQKQEQVHRARSATAGPVTIARRLAFRVPLLTALVLALAAVWLAPSVPILATLLGVAAAACIFAPYVMRRPSSDLADQKRWRGQPVGVPRSATGFRGLIDSTRDRLQK